MEIKLKCSSCGEIKGTDRFNRSKASKTGYNNWCKDCKKNYYLTNKEFILEKDRRRREQGSEIINLRRRQAYAEDSSEVLIRNRVWRENNPDKVKLCSQRDRDKHWKMHLIRAAGQRAKRKGLMFDITMNNIEWPDVCPVLGIALSRGTRTDKDSSPSLDRVDNSKGYVAGNVVVISNRANSIKRNGTAEEHEKIAQWMRTKGVS